MKFKYSQFINIEGKVISRPSIPILFKSKNRFIYVKAIIDSGADYTILPVEIAGELGLKLSSKCKNSFYGAGGNPFVVYESPQSIEHIIRQTGFRPIKWFTKVYFAESQPCILLGNIGFLNRFRLTLDGLLSEVKMV